MDDVYELLYEEYALAYTHSEYDHDAKKWVVVKPMSMCSHAQINAILQVLDEDEDIVLVLEAMHSCIGCIGNSVPALED